MRLVEIPNLEYKTFEKIRDAIYRNESYAVIHIGYSPGNKLGIFNFWDSDYIPDELKPFVKIIPGSREKMQKISDELKPIVTELELIKMTR